MPRDLESERETLDGMPPLSSAPRRHSEPHPDNKEASFTSTTKPDQTNEEADDFLWRECRRDFARNQMHLFSRSLTIDDIDDCEALENAAFPEELRASREKFDYRLRKCSNLAFAMYMPYNPETDASSTSPMAELRENAPTLATATSVESNDPVRKKLLVAHVISTLSTNPTVKDEDMALPPRQPAPTPSDPDHKEWTVPDPSQTPRPGHKDEGRTICLHSLAVLPSLQGKGLGQAILKAYIERMESAGVGDRIALLCVENLVPFYERAGFKTLGPSDATFGGTPWFDMVRELKSQDEQIEELVRFQRLRSGEEEVEAVDGREEQPGEEQPEEGVSQR